MIDNANILVLPDIHGRTFWIEPCKDAIENNIDIVFLGDYFDPYSHEGEWVYEDMMNNFNSIVELKKAHPDHVHLLLGNHDCSYVYAPSFCYCRHDHIHHNDIKKAFFDNHDLFELMYRKEINGKQFVFSHAGILKSWLENHKEFFDSNIENVLDVVDELNSYFKRFMESPIETNKMLWVPLSDTAFLRGGYDTCGSPLWADIREFAYYDDIYEKDIIQVVGHTQLNDGAISFNGKIYCIDSRQAFIVDNTGVVMTYNEPYENKIIKTEIKKENE